MGLPRMLFFCRQIQIVCTLAFFLMAGAQVLHACVDLSCAAEHASEENSHGQDAQDCPLGHCCCQAHSGMNLSLTDAPDFIFLTVAAKTYPIQNEVWGDGPCREIDHPPQLS